MVFELPALRSIQRLQNEIGTVQKSFAQLNNLQKQMKTTTFNVNSVFANYHSSVANLSKSLQISMEPILEISRALQNSTRPIKFATENLLVNMQPHSEVLQQLRETTKLLSSLRQPIEFTDSFKYVCDRYEALYDEGELNPVEALTEEIEEKISLHENKPLSTEFYISMLFAVMLFVLSQTSAIESEENIQNAISELKALVAENKRVHHSLEGQVTFYIALRSVNLREGPGTKFTSTSIVHPNTKVILLERDKKWIRVEYFDNLSEVSKEGWVYKKYLKRLGGRKICP